MPKYSSSLKNLVSAHSIPQRRSTTLYRQGTSVSFINMLPHSFNEAKECHPSTQHHHARASPWGSANTQTMLRTHLYQYQIDLTWIWQIQSWDVRGCRSTRRNREHEVCKRTVLPHCWGISLSPVSFKFTLLPKPKLVPKNFHTNFIWPQWNLTAFNANLHVKTSPLLGQEKKTKNIFRELFSGWRMCPLPEVCTSLLLHCSRLVVDRVSPPLQSFFSPLQYECGLQRRVTTTI